MSYSKTLVFIVLLATTLQVQAQSIEITPQTGFTLGGKVYARTGELRIQNSESYGASLNIVQNNVSLQFEYFYQPTVGDYRNYFNSDLNQSADLRISWFQLGIRQRFNAKGNMVPFTGLSIGLTNFALESSPDEYNEIALSFGLQAGTNIYLSERIGLRFHTRLQMPVQFNGFGFYAGSGGSGAMASAGAYFIQGDFGAGLIIRLPK